jgi:hypothetical protein
VAVARIISGDHPFHRLDGATITDFSQTLPGREDQQKIARLNAKSLYGLEQPTSRAGDQAAQLQEQS